MGWKIVSDKSKVIITNSTKKGHEVADNVEVRNAKKLLLKFRIKIKFNLLYDKNTSLQKIKLEQLRKEQIRSGALITTRTANLLITNQLLYQLS